MTATASPPAAVPPHDLEAEESVLGSVLLTGRTVAEQLLVDRALAAEHFYAERHAIVFRAIARMVDRQAEIDVLTVSDQLAADGQLDRVGGRAAIDALCGAAPSAVHVSEYARIVRRKATWRVRLRAGQEIAASALKEDEARFGTAEASLGRGDHLAEDRDHGPERSASELFDYFAGRGGNDQLWPIPFARLNEQVDGLGVGDTTLVAGWSSMGKSGLCDGRLEFAADEHGAHTRIYMNEMSVRDRQLRSVAALTGIPFKRLRRRRDLTDQEHRRAARALEHVHARSHGYTECSGWGVHDIARHIRRHRWDLCGIDMVGLIPAPPGFSNRTAALDEIVRVLIGAAREADCHIILLSQLNRASATGGELPIPVQRDIRDSGSLYDYMHNVVFVHRVQVPVETDQGVVWAKTNDGIVVFDKSRSGEAGTSTAVTFDHRRLRYREAGLL